MPKVTIVIPTLNVKKYLRQCLDSILNQTLKDIEVFIVDAASTDGTRDIIKSYIQKDTRVSLLEDEKKSTGYAKNIGIDLATSPYVAIVEPDDYIESDMMETLYDIAEKNSVDFVKSDFSTFLGQAKSRMDFPKTVSPNPDDYGKVIDPRKDNHCFRWIMFEWLGLYRKSFLDAYHIRHNESPGAAFQDTGFWFLTFAYAKKIYLCRKSFYHYRCDNPHASVKNPNKVFNICMEYDYIQKKLKQDYDIWKRVQSAFYRGYFYDNCVAYTRIAEKLRFPLLQEMQRTLRVAQKQGFLDESLYTNTEWNDLQLLLQSEYDFEDEKSKNILNGKNAFMRMMNQIREKRFIVIYGAGSYGCNLHYLLLQNGMEPVAYADSDLAKCGKVQNGIPILSMQECEQKFDVPFYLIANKYCENEIAKKLIDNRITNERFLKCDVGQMMPIMI